MRVILADDAVIIREGLARLLAEHGVEVVGQAADATGLLRLVDSDPPDVAVVDIRMPPTFTNEGLKAAQLIRRHHADVGVVVLSQYVEAQYALKLMDGTHGGVGYLLKHRIGDILDFTSALAQVDRGLTVIDPCLVSELIDSPMTRDPLASLSAREREVLALIAEGRTDRGISNELVVTRKTVEAHIRSIFRKLELPVDAGENRRVHAVLTFLQHAGSRLD